MRNGVLLFLLLLVLISGQAQPKRQPVNKAELFDKYIQTALPLWKTTGLAVAVVKDGQVIFSKGYGETKLNSGRPFTTSTIAFCASTTKAMTAACVAMLVDEGKLKWDDRLKDILPSFRLYDPYVSDEVTVRDLLRHNAGLGNGDYLWLFGYSSEEILRRMRFMKPAYSMRSSFIYQNLMYVVAGEVIRQVSGLPWHDFIQQRIFQPLGMEHTYTKLSDASAEASVMTPHFFYGDTVVKAIDTIGFGGYDPAGSVVSCIDDMAKWMKFLQDSAKLNGKRLISARNFTELFKPQSIIPPAEFYPTMDLTKPHWTTYGLGWFQQDYRGRMYQFHTGSLDGAIAIFGSLPEEKFSIYIFANLDHSELRHALMWKATDLWCFDDVNGRDWSTALFNHYKGIREAGRAREKERESRRVPGTRTTLPVDSLLGRYANETYGDAWVEKREEELWLRFPNHINLKLKHWNYDVFRGYFEYEWYGKSWISFSISSEAKIAQFEFDGIPYRKEN